MPPSARPPRSPAARRRSAAGTSGWTRGILSASLPERRTARAFGALDLDDADGAAARRLRQQRRRRPRPSAFPSSTTGTIESTGDVDWFKFQAAAGKSYVFTVGLGTLPDSVLVSLRQQRRQAVGLQRRLRLGQRLANRVDRAGKRRLLPCRRPAMAAATGNLRARRRRPKRGPGPNPFGNQTLPYSQTTLTIPLHASDADGDSLTYSAQAMTIDRLAQKAYSLDQQLGLHMCANGSYYDQCPGARREVHAGQRQ